MTAGSCGRTWLDHDHQHVDAFETFANFIETNAFRMTYT